ncbi:MAG: LuxR C-terminal-related transcriptional regulator [Gammaproteobacteria bacterium]
MKTKDWIALVEAGYTLDETDEIWTENVLDQALPLFERGRWPSIATYHYTPTTLHFDHVAIRGPAFAARAIRASESLNPELIDLLYRSGNIVGSLSEVVFTRFPNQSTPFRRWTLNRLGDVIGITAHSADGEALVFSLGFAKQVSSTVRERQRWGLICSHLGAGLRLRKWVQPLLLDTAPVEAIFDPGGKLQDARDPAVKPASRQLLRDTVRRLDRIRSQSGRSDPDAALAAWEGLVQGRWSLVDHFDTDRRRFVVAIRNDPTYADPRGLTMRERQVAEWIGLGQSTKAIGYNLGISQSAVTNCTARVQLKLGLASLAEIAAFFAPTGLRTKLAEYVVRGEALLVGAYPLVDEDRVKDLTDAEKAILAQLLAGSTNGDIAQRRKTSAYTVANQVQTIFRKIGVRSRSELAARLQCPA